MSLVDEARKLKQNDIVLAVGIFISVIAPGFLTIYRYKPALVGSLDTFKLLIFSAALTLPMVIVSHFATSVLAGEKNKDEHAAIFATAMAMTCLVLYLALLVSYFASLTFKWYLVSAVGFQVLLFLVLYIDQRYSKKP